MGMDIKSKIYIGIFGEKNLSKIPNSLILEIKEEQMGKFQLADGVEVYLEAVVNDSIDCKDHKLLGIGIPLSSIHNRSDDFWVKEFSFKPDIARERDVSLLQNFSDLYNVELSFFHALGLSF